MSTSTYPPAEQSYHHLHRSGWSGGEAGSTGSSGRTNWQVDRRHGGNRLKSTVRYPLELGIALLWQRRSTEGPRRKPLAPSLAAVA
jgi:hypothetical protein